MVRTDDRKRGEEEEKEDTEKGVSDEALELVDEDEDEDMGMAEDSDDDNKWE